VIPAGEHTSSIIMISDPRAICVSNVPSGEKKCADQSYGERNLTQSGVSFASDFHDFHFANEKA
jgi:hypothetical protein